MGLTPYYADDSVRIYCGNCWDWPVPDSMLDKTMLADVIITDPPYDARTHAGARTLAKDAEDGKIEIAFPPFDVERVPEMLLWAKRWVVCFCALEMLGEYQRCASPSRYIRGGFYRRIDGAPQISGDRPAQPGEGLAIMHASGKKRWNGGGSHGFYEGHVVHGPQRVHPTQKPEAVMQMLVADFSDPGEVILDPFMGSGSTLVAAKRYGRRAIGIEIEEKYCAAAAARLQQSALSFGE